MLEVGNSSFGVFLGACFLEVRYIREGFSIFFYVVGFCYGEVLIGFFYIFRDCISVRIRNKGF